MTIPTVLHIKIITRTARTTRPETARSWVVRFAELTTHLLLLQHSHNLDLARDCPVRRVLWLTDSRSSCAAFANAAESTLSLLSPFLWGILATIAVERFRMRGRHFP